MTAENLDLDQGRSGGLSRRMETVVLEEKKVQPGQENLGSISNPPADTDKAMTHPVGSMQFEVYRVEREPKWVHLAKGRETLPYCP